MNGRKLQQFKTLIWSYYAEHKRSFAWRRTTNPYHIMVSEIMLQQTQTDRVIPKYDQFLTEFPTINLLARAPLRDILSCWQGLGYNRRALGLHKAAQIIMADFGGAIPDDPVILDTLPCIGKNTAASICAFAFNKPTVFIETNIRSVFIYHFFRNEIEVKDSDMYPLIVQTVDQENPREWYYALMDYGSMLKKQITNPSRRSAHYARQSKFEGSERQIRGMILKIVTSQPTSYAQLTQLIDREPQRIKKNLVALCSEGFIREKGCLFKIV